ncbi:hypothetical protein GO491_00050 [Flavobacteriaceae bacterium Ap0902]|nr:hypothetical protein [Flavobacteriaceae bacterium Ap0902]
MLRSRTFQKIQFYWIIISIILLFLGLFTASSSIMIGYVPVGQFLMIISGSSILIYLIVAILQWFRFKKGHGFKNFITAYILLSILMILGGLAGALFTYPDGMTIFITGLGLLGGFWVFKLIQFIFMKEEDFLKR